MDSRLEDGMDSAEMQRRTHLFQDADPEAPCPSCGFPSWSHDPGTAVLWNRRIVPPDSLDSAWDAAEAALPEGIDGLYVERDRLGGRIRYYAGTWIPGPPGRRGTDAGKGDTPAAALRTLDAKLRKVK